MTDYTLMDLVVDVGYAAALGCVFIAVMVSSAWVVSRFMRGSRP